ncbi:hypothetical protein SAMN05443634_10655 [Chishuiella changwenlii]|uniref:Uncharacterized protein n=1 Tax=Chishuiella changwenlii TaxID=1434701 RepID=A0A1M6Y255_9FLAO|nr:hypothetical protein [Chishuiella changwenlii]GGE93775.1 hypothetical protein GCM10010984_09260 [Chishuiella changwenlii]SHL12297.1 hypothetical protein SAMN05443634_10655 [Chishuiella changwenlii]
MSNSEVIIHTRLLDIHLVLVSGGWRLEVGGWRLEVGGWKVKNYSVIFCLLDLFFEMKNEEKLYNEILK